MAVGRANALFRANVLEYPAQLRRPEPVQTDDKVILVSCKSAGRFSPITHIGVSPLEDYLPGTEAVDQVPIAVLVRVEVAFDFRSTKSP